ncbi:MAG: glycosyltransferase [Phormidesmis sp.]
MRIAFYLNLQGAGHCRRFEAIAPHFPSNCQLAVVGMDGPPPIIQVSRPVHRVSVPGFAPPADSAFLQQQTLHDYHGFLVNHGGNAAFALAMVSFLSEWQPDLLVVDVGLEAAILARMCGIPTIYGRQHGRRWDKGHTLAYEWAHSLWAPFAAAMEQADCPQWIREKTVYSGGFCRFTGKEKARQKPVSYSGEKPNVLVMTGFGGTEITSEKIADAAAANPQWQWHFLGKQTASISEIVDCPGVVDDVWPYLCGADWVIANAGHNAVMEIAAAGVPLVCIPAARPFAEQTCKAEVLQRLKLSVVSQWPAPSEWPGLWQKATRLNPSAWEGLQSQQAPQQAAQYITSIAQQCVSQTSVDST